MKQCETCERSCLFMPTKKETNFEFYIGNRFGNYFKLRANKTFQYFNELDLQMDTIINASRESRLFLLFKFVFHLNNSAFS